MKHLNLCCFAPHAPILVPEVGGRQLDEVPGTRASLERLAIEIEELQPDAVVIVSPPHLRLACRDAFPLKTGRVLEGGLARFGAPASALSMSIDGVLSAALEEKARTSGVPLFSDAVESEDDWGALVPLLLLAPPRAAVVALNVSPTLDLTDHSKLGACLRESVEESGRNAVFIASGDMSHRLKPGAPSGYSPRGIDFDREVVDIMREGDLRRLFEIDKELREEAGEDCLWSLAVLAGVIDGYAARVDVLSYEGSFGVGYMVARIAPGEPAASRRPGSA